MKAGRLAVCAFFALKGCVPLPLEGDVTYRSIPTVEANSALRPGEQVVVLGGFGTKDDGDVPECLRDELVRATPSMRLMQAREFRSTFTRYVFSSPWPDTVAAMTSARDRPEVMALAAERRLRYAIVATSDTVSRSQQATGGSVPVAVGSEDETTTLTARLWDMTAATPPLTLIIRTTAEATMLFVGIGGFVQLPITEAPACREMARQITALLAGRQAATAVRARVENSLTRRQHE